MNVCNDGARPRVSIIMPAYNAKAYIGQAIESAIAQTFPDWELIVVDDCSTDDTAACVRSYSDSRVRYFKNERNSGVAYTRNCGIEAARGEYIAFLDSDDVWLPCKLAAQVRQLDTGALISYGAYYRIAADGKRLSMVNVPPALCYRDMLKSNFIGHLTGVYNKSRFPDLRFESGGHEDYVFWLRAVKIAGVIHAALPGTPLANYRVLENSLSADKKKALRWQWRIYRDVLQFSIGKSFYYFTFYVLNAVRKRCGFISSR